MAEPESGQIVRRGIGWLACLLGLTLAFGSSPTMAESVVLSFATPATSDPSPGPGLTQPVPSLLTCTSASTGADCSNLEPGDTVLLALDLANPLSIPATVTLSSSKGGALFSGPNPATADAPAAQVTLQPGQAVPETVRVALPISMDNSYEGATGAVTLQVQWQPVPTSCAGACEAPGSLPVPSVPPSSNPPGACSTGCAPQLPIPSVPPAPQPPGTHIPPGPGATTVVPVRLPKTGASVWPFLTGAGLLLIGLRLVLPRGRRRGDVGPRG